MSGLATSPADAGDQPAPHGDVLVVGLSARALAESAARAGFRPVAVDFFGDLDLRSAASGVSLGRSGRRWSPAAAARASGDVAAPSVAYAMDLENAPDAVRRAGRGRELLGNAPETLRAVRDPRRLFAELRRAGVRTPVTRFDGFAADRGRWLRKPRAGGGGRGVTAAAPNERLRRDELLQERLEGPVLGLSFLADGRACRPLALSLQIADRAAFGAEEFGYCGSVSALPADLDEAGVREQAFRAAQVVTRAFGLRGWNGMDFVVERGEVVPLEVNPRHTSSMELWDDDGTRLFAAHVAACRGEPAALEGGWLPAPREVRGKAVLFARVDAVARDTRAASRAPTEGGWAEAASAGWRQRPLGDVPHPNDVIPRGHPVCSLFAAARDSGACLDRLRGLARRVESELLAPGSAPARPSRPGGRPLAPAVAVGAARDDPRA